MEKFSITEGLGDCLIAGASAQRLAINKKEKVRLHTNPLLAPVFESNPYVELLDSSQGCQKLLWPSQFHTKKEKEEYFNLHTMQRFSKQMGFIINPSDTLSYYQNGKIQLNSPCKKAVCINQYSAEKNRRFIPDQYINLLIRLLSEMGYEIIFIGDNESGRHSISNVQESINALLDCALFIGPVSFQYHLAAMLKVSCLTFFSYMPYWLYAHFDCTYPIYSTNSCVIPCEIREQQTRDSVNCWGGCRAVYYNEELIKIQLKLILDAKHNS
jgi:ADP-heptose:LPS heptosyltransferase